MKAKEKAKELVEKFTLIDEMFIGSAKKCAIICVDEILFYYPVAVDDERSKSFNEYWKSVKTEIQNDGLTSSEADLIIQGGLS
jgi:hypothetical protein